MTEKRRTAEQILHENWVVPWIERLNLTGIHINFKLVDKIDDTTPKTIAVCYTNSPYNAADIDILESWYIDCLEDGDEQAIEFAVVHELCHLILIPLTGGVAGYVPRKLWDDYEHKVEGLCDSMAVQYTSIYHGEKRGISPWN